MAIKDRMKITQWWWLQERFWEKVRRGSEDECWEWRGSREGDGHARIEAAGLRFLVHRVAYEIAGGIIPPDMVVMHSCDFGLCCNPKHLKVGTPLDNINDMILKKRGSVKLDQAQVEAIRDDNRKQRIIAHEYKISQSLVSLIKSEKRRKEFPNVSS
jgi:hypothetical protein